MLFLLYGIVFSKQNAVILTLCRNSDLNGIASSIENLENRFNKKYK